MKRFLIAALVLLAIGPPALAQFDFRTQGTRTQKFLVFTAAASTPALSNPDEAVIFYDATCDCIKVSENGGGYFAINAVAGTSGEVLTVFGRGGPYVVAQAGDYTAAQITATPFGTITGENVQDQLEEIDARISAAPVTSVFGRTGAITANSGDYTATKITSSATGDVAALTVQAAIAELASEKVAAGTASTISGTKTFSSTSGVIIQPGSAPAANTKMLDVRNNSGVSKFYADAEGDVTAGQVVMTSGTTTGAFAAGGALSSSTSLSVFGTATITGAATFSSDIDLTSTAASLTNLWTTDTAAASDQTFHLRSGSLAGVGGTVTLKLTRYRSDYAGYNPEDSWKFTTSSTGLGLSHAPAYGASPVTNKKIWDVDPTTWTTTYYKPIVMSGTVSLGASASATTPATADNTTLVATTAFVQAQKADIALTGNPTAPTAAPGDNDTSIATTAFVTNAVASTGVASFNTRTGAVTGVQADYDGFFLTPAEGDTAYVNVGGDTLTGTLNGTALSMSSATGLTLSNAAATISHTGATSLGINTTGGSVRVNQGSTAGADFRVYNAGTATLNLHAIDSTGDLRVRGKVQGGNSGGNISASLAGEFQGANGAISGNQVSGFYDNTAGFGAGIGAGLALGFKYNTGGTLTNSVVLKAMKETAVDGDYGGALALATRANGSAVSEKARITGAGRLGIASTSPSSLLHVGSGSPVSAWFDAASEDGITVAPNVATARVAIAGTGSAGLVLYDSGAGADVKTSRIVNDGGTTSIEKTPDDFSSSTSLLSFNHSTLASTFGADVNIQSASSDGTWLRGSNTGTSTGEFVIVRNGLDPGVAEGAIVSAFTDQGQNPLTFRPLIAPAADSGLRNAVVIDARTRTALESGAYGATAANLLSLQNNGTIKLYVDANGTVYPAGISVSGAVSLGAAATATTATSTDNDTSLATTAFVQAQKTSPTLVTPTINDLRGVSRITGANTLAPTFTGTGFGTSPTLAGVAGTSDLAGVVQITAGTTPSASGTLTITFSAGSGYGANSAGCVAMLGNSTGTWNARATLQQGAVGTASVAFAWDNNAVNLTAGQIYRVSYICIGK